MSAAATGFRKESRKKSSKGSVGFAFSKGSAGGGKWAGMGKFGDIDFLKRLLGRAGTNMKNFSGQTELLLMAQLGDFDAIQLLRNSGLEAKDALGDLTLQALALTGDIDAERLLEMKGLRVRKKVTGEDIDGFATPMTASFGMASDFGIVPEVVYAPAQTEAAPESPLRKALAAAGQRINRMRSASQQEKRFYTALGSKLSKPPG